MWRLIILHKVLVGIMSIKGLAQYLKYSISRQTDLQIF